MDLSTPYSAKNLPIGKADFIPKLEDVLGKQNFAKFTNQIDSSNSFGANFFGTNICSSFDQKNQNFLTAKAKNFQKQNYED